MDFQDFYDVVTRRWPVVLASLVLALGATLAYAKHQQRIYQASSTLFAAPSSFVSQPGEINGNLGLLTYGNLADTFASLAQSQALLGEAGRQVGVSAQTLSDYTASASSLPSTTVLQILVQGPSAPLAARLADALVLRTAAATARYFRVFTLTPLDRATVPRAPIRPQTAHDALYAGLAGLVVGYVAAIASLRWPGLVAAARADGPANMPGPGDLPALDLMPDGRVDRRVGEPSEQ